MSTLFSVPLSTMTQIPWIEVRNIFEVRERDSSMYHWTALVTAQILVELPISTVTAAALVITYGWTAGIESSRMGFTFLVMLIPWAWYYQTWAQWVAAMSPTVEVANLIFPLLFTFVNLYCGVIQPFQIMGWWKWYAPVSAVRSRVRPEVD